MTTWTGWEFDSASLELRIPAARLTLLRARLRTFRVSSSTSTAALQSLAGVLSFVARGVAPLRPFTSALFAALRGAPAHARVHLSSTVHADLDLINHFLSHYNGVSLLPRPFALSTALVVFCYASPWGYGIVFPALRIYASEAWPSAALAALHINILELVTAVISTVLAPHVCPLRAHSQLLLRIDNTVAEGCVRKLYSSSPDLATPTRALALFFALTSVSALPQRVPSAENMADAPSRGLPTPHLGTRVPVPPSWALSLTAPSLTYAVVAHWAATALGSATSAPS